MAEDAEDSDDEEEVIAEVPATEDNINELATLLKTTICSSC